MDGDFTLDILFDWRLFEVLLIVTYFDACMSCIVKAPTIGVVLFRYWAVIVIRVDGDLVFR